MATDPEKIGIYGGTFDPIHCGHLILARDAVELLDLSQLIFIPAAISPHKLTRHPGASGEMRLQMLAAAVAGEPRFAVDDCELRRAGPSYAFDTVQALRARRPAASEWFYLIGEDNVPELHTWHRIDELRALVRFVVFRRRADFTHSPAVDSTPPLELAAAAGFPTLDRLVDISATEIRKRVASGRSIRYLVPEAVERIIAAESFYHCQPGV
jgi:nicotinate-nucleotide adenylyltransferase